jgi:hypothetical protein
MDGCGGGRLHGGVDTRPYRRGGPLVGILDKDSLKAHRWANTECHQRTGVPGRRPNNAIEDEAAWKAIREAARVAPLNLS